MSLDVYLEMPGELRTYEARIFVSDDGSNRELTRTEWDSRFPGREPATFSEVETNVVFSSNITHNLNKMAEEAGIYKHCWRPEEIGITAAKQLIEPLRAALVLMRSDPERFKKHDAPNGWGLYQHFVPWVAEYLAACEEYPEAYVRVSR